MLSVNASTQTDVLMKVQYIYFSHVRVITIIVYYWVVFCCCIRTQVLKKCI